jgi:Glu-tRNA(Gln) amidotransferase subunit E-like FAD-binding protein
VPEDVVERNVARQINLKRIEELKELKEQGELDAAKI